MSTCLQGGLGRLRAGLPCPWGDRVALVWVPPQPWSCWDQEDARGHWGSTDLSSQSSETEARRQRPAAGEGGMVMLPAKAEPLSVLLGDSDDGQGWGQGSVPLGRGWVGIAQPQAGKLRHRASTMGI